METKNSDLTHLIERLASVRIISRVLGDVGRSDYLLHSPIRAPFSFEGLLRAAQSGKRVDEGDVNVGPNAVGVPRRE